jgi:excisionase family DNA binding protein
MSTEKIVLERSGVVQPRAFSIAQTATILGVSPISIRRLIARGLLRPNRSLRHLRIPESEITRFLAQS